jgi:glycosyltransferase involved in cell wall biosynthesis
MRILIVYDCLFPYTIGGGERWYRNLAERLTADGHEVTYLTLRQWDRAEGPDLPGVNVVVAGPRMALYSGPGQRRPLPPLVFGAGVLWHLLRHGRRYDVVHTISFPYFSLLAAAVARPLHRFRLATDWFELWTREYWTEYLGAVGGRIGWTVQKLCLKVRQDAFCYARLTADRVRKEGLNGTVTMVRGLYDGPATPAAPQPAEPLVVFAGRMIPEKRAPMAVEAFALARRELPELKGVIFGDGPDRPKVLEAIAQHGLEGAVEAPGFAPTEQVETTLARAACLLHPSRREGYGLVVVEASAAGVPTVLAAGDDNAAVELVEEGVNGFVAATADAPALARAVVRAVRAGPELRRSASDWFVRNAPSLSLDASLDLVSGIYRKDP